MSAATLPRRVLLLAALAGLIVIYALIQPRVEYFDGHPYDADSYYRMAEQVAAGQPVSELHPFASRVALPWLAGTLFPGDVMLGFTLLNLLFAVAGLVVLGLYLREFLANDVLVIGLLILFAASPNSPFRFTWFIPAYTDPPALFFMGLILLLGRRWPRFSPAHVLLVAGLGFIGALFREIVLCAVLVVAFTHAARLIPRPPFVKPDSARDLGLSLVPLVATVAGILLARWLVEETGEYSYFVQMRGVIMQLSQQLSIYPLAWLTAFGMVPLVVLLTVDRRMLAFLGANQDVLLFLAGMALVAATTGFHTDRLVFWSYPALLVLFGRSLESIAVALRGSLAKVLFFGPLVLIQILAFRALWPLPGDASGALYDPGAAPGLLFSVYGEGVNLGQFYASSMLPVDRVVLLVQYGLAAAYLGLVLYRNGWHASQQNRGSTTLT